MASGSPPYGQGRDEIGQEQPRVDDVRAKPLYLARQSPHHTDVPPSTAAEGGNGTTHPRELLREAVRRLKQYHGRFNRGAMEPPHQLDELRLRAGPGEVVDDVQDARALGSRQADAPAVAGGARTRPASRRRSQSSRARMVKIWRERSTRPAMCARTRRSTTSGRRKPRRATASGASVSSTRVFRGPRSHAPTG